MNEKIQLLHTRVTKSQQVKQMVSQMDRREVNLGSLLQLPFMENGQKSSLSSKRFSYFCYFKRITVKGGKAFSRGTEVSKSLRKLIALSRG